MNRSEKKAHKEGTFNQGLEGEKRLVNLGHDFEASAPCDDTGMST